MSGFKQGQWHNTERKKKDSALESEFIKHIKSQCRTSRKSIGSNILNKTLTQDMYKGPLY